jgi:hypothetical protein
MVIAAAKRGTASRNASGASSPQDRRSGPRSSGTAGFSACVEGNFRPAAHQGVPAPSRSFGNRRVVQGGRNRAPPFEFAARPELSVTSGSARTADA